MFFEAILVIKPQHILALIALNMGHEVQRKTIDFKAADQELEQILVDVENLKFSSYEYIAYAKFLAKSESHPDREKDQQIFDKVIQCFQHNEKAHVERIKCTMTY
jgi:hypothetical protein